MKIDKDLSGFDAVDKWEDSLWQTVADVGLDAVRFAKENGEYKNHTHNLRNAPGYAVVKDGKISKMDVPSDGNHAEARMKTEDFIRGGNKPQNGLILADGMYYASFVESKGFDVLGNAALHADGELNKKLNN